MNLRNKLSFEHNYPQDTYTGVGHKKNNPPKKFEKKEKTSPLNSSILWEPLPKNKLKNKILNSTNTNVGNQNHYSPEDIEIDADGNEYRKVTNKRKIKT